MLHFSLDVYVFISSYMLYFSLDVYVFLYSYMMYFSLVVYLFLSLIILARSGKVKVPAHR